MLRSPPARPAAPEAGFSLLEALFGGVILALALMGHAASTLAENRLVKEERARSEALQVVRQFMERLRSDDDWEGLYARLRIIEAKASLPGTKGERLSDGRVALPPYLYYADFSPSVSLADLRVLIDVPTSPDDEQPLGVLREDLADPRFGLPADLDGDGTVDGDRHDADYVALPVRVIFFWSAPGQGTRETVVATWLRGSR